jgi:hypothetical protein
LSRLLSYLRGALLTRGETTEDPTETPQYGESVSYTPCRECGEGVLQYDEELGGTRCTVCGTTDERGGG